MVLNQVQLLGIPCLQYFHGMGYTSWLADPDIWMHHGEHYCEYIFVYVDDMLVLSEKPSDTKEA